mgnify:CR=1 FL=1
MGRASLLGLALVSAVSLTGCETAGWPFNDGRSERASRHHRGEHGDREQLEQQGGY